MFYSISNRHFATLNSAKLWFFISFESKVNQKNPAGTGLFN